MGITATHIGQSTVKITNSFNLDSGFFDPANPTVTQMVSFKKFSDTVAAAICGSRDATVIGQTASALYEAVDQTGTKFVTPVFTTIPGVNPQLTSGWELIDSFWGDENPVYQTESPIFTQIFKAKNKDTHSHKNIIVRYHTTKMEINTSTCDDVVLHYTINGSNVDRAINDSWAYTQVQSGPVVSRTIINECWTYFDCSPVGYNLTACDMLIMVSPKWCMFHSYLNDEPSLWSGVFENEREDTMDKVVVSLDQNNVTHVTGNPCWGWIGSTLWMLGAADVGSKPLNGFDYTLWSMPSTKQGSGVVSAKGWGADYSATFHPHFLGTTVASFIYYLGNSANKFITSGWDSTRKLAMPIKPIADFAGQSLVNYGGLFGLKVIAPAGSNMSKIMIPTDADGNSAATGDNRYHWLLNNHFKRTPNNVETWAGNTTWSYAPYSLGSGSIGPVAMVTTGAANYVITTGGSKVVRVNAATGEFKDVLTGGNYTDMKYDGERYIYVTSSTPGIALTRIDTSGLDPKITTRSETGFSSLVIAHNRIFCSNKTAGTNNTIFVYQRRAFDTVYSQTAAQNAILQDINYATITVPTLVTGQTGVGPSLAIFSMTMDFDGNIWAVAGTASTTTNVATAAADFRLMKIIPTVDPVSNVIGFSSVTIAPAVTAPVVNFALQMLDGDNLVVWAAQHAGAMHQIQINPREADPTKIVLSVKTAVNGTLATPGTWGSTSSSQCSNLITAGVVTSGVMTCDKIDGILFVMPRNSDKAYGNACVGNSLGRIVSLNAFTPPALLDAPIYGSDQYGGNGVSGYQALSGAIKNSFICYDGARLYSNTDSALKVWTNVHGSNNVGGAVSNATTIGQVCIPA